MGRLHFRYPRRIDHYWLPAPVPFVAGCFAATVPLRPQFSSSKTHWVVARSGIYQFIHLYSIFICMHDEIALIKRYMRQKHLDQAALASEAGVSQATVSRALAGIHERRGRAIRQLLSHITVRAGKAPASVTGKKRVASAFEKIWDGSDAHAAAVAKIIEDLAGLTPSPTLRRRLEQRKRA